MRHETHIYIHGPTSRAFWLWRMVVLLAILKAVQVGHNSGHWFANWGCVPFMFAFGWPRQAQACLAFCVRHLIAFARNLWAVRQLRLDMDSAGKEDNKSPRL